VRSWAKGTGRPFGTPVLIKCPGSETRATGTPAFRKPLREPAGGLILPADGFLNEWKTGGPRARSPLLIKPSGNWCARSPFAGLWNRLGSPPDGPPLDTCNHPDDDRRMPCSAAIQTTGMPVHSLPPERLQRCGLDPANAGDVPSAVQAASEPRPTPPSKMIPAYPVSPAGVGNNPGGMTPARVAIAPLVFWTPSSFTD